MGDLRARLSVVDRAPEPDMWPEIRRRSTSPRPTPARGTNRLVAAAVAVMLAASAGFFVWQAFRTAPPRPAAPRAPEGVLRLQAAPARPVASLEFGGVIREGAGRSFCWQQGPGRELCVEALEWPLRPKDYLRIPRGTTLTIVTDARDVLATRSSAGSGTTLDTRGDRLVIDWEVGSYAVVATGVWPQGVVPFWFGIEVTPPATCLSADEPGLLTCEEVLASVRPFGSPKVGEPARVEASLSWLRVQVGAEPIRVWRVRYVDVDITFVDVPTSDGPDERACGRGDWVMTADARTARIYRSGTSGLEAQPCPSRDRHDPWPEGIFGRREVADFPPSQGSVFRNLWRGRIRGHRVAVYAGVRVESDERAIYRPTGEGTVLIRGWNPEEGRKRLFTDYSTPIPGPVKIVDADGHVLRLRSLADGSEVLFDVLSGDFRSG